LKLGIMQPYFLPYIGYWQLMNAVDQYVVYDDVNYIKGGWIGRNRILVNGAPKYFNLPLLGASPNKLIREVVVNPNPAERGKAVRQIEAAYKKAPHFAAVMPLLEEIMSCEKESVADFLMESFHVIGEYLGIRTELILSSQLNKDCSLRGQEKVLAICQLLGASEYYNAIGGQELYSREAFAKQGIDLRFLKTGDIAYPQFGESFEPHLSILDVMMFCSQEEIRELLQKYTLL